MAPQAKKPFKVGQIVWVKTGRVNEEIGTVQALDCEFFPPFEEGEPEPEERFDGINIVLSTFGAEQVFAPELVRPVEDDNGGGRRSSSRRSKEVAVPSSASVSASIAAERSVVTPSPSASMVMEVEEVKDSKPKAKKKLSASKATGKRKRKDDDDSDPGKDKDEEPKMDEIEGDGADGKNKGKRGQEKSKVRKGEATSSKRKKKDPSDSSDAPPQKIAKDDKGSKPPPKSKRAPKKKEEPPPEEQFSPAEFSHDTDSDNYGDAYGEDRPFRIDRAPSSRSSCRRCSDVIEKGTLRVSHKPLFRGKPGYVVYRHLKCATFNEHLKSAHQIGGYRKLNKPELAALKQRLIESQQELEEENREIQPDELVPVAFEGEIRKAPPGLAAALLPFQVEGTSWMHHQEVCVPDMRGGILADEMGMGKTLQTIVTILDNRPKLQTCVPGAKHAPNAPDFAELQAEEELWATAAKQWQEEMTVNKIPKRLWPKTSQGGNGCMRAGTLVICPVIALNQWKSEIAKFCTLNALSVAIYHGPNRAKDLPLTEFSKYDVILTTYQVLEQDYRKMVSPNKVSCPNCGGKFKLDKLRVHLKYFCGEAAQRTEAQMRQRRTAQRRGRNNDVGEGGGGGRKTFKKGTSQKKPPITQTTTKKTIRVQKTKGYDSDSDLSVEEEQTTPTSGGRPSRSAAVSASKKLSASVQSWGKTKQEFDKDDDESMEDIEPPSSSSSDDDDEPEIEESDSAESEEEDKEPVIKKRAPVKKKPTKSRGGKRGKQSSSEEEESEEAPRKKGRAAAKKRVKAKHVRQELTSDEESSDGEVEAAGKKRGKKKPPAKKQPAAKKGGKRKAAAPPSDDEDDDDDSSDDDLPVAKVAKKQQSKPYGKMTAAERAREKQRQALEMAAEKRKASSKAKTGTKKQPAGKKKAAAKGRKKKDESDGDGDDSSSDDEVDPKDPMAGIDMAKLLQQAMAGARCSVLHSFSWWRIVLDEAHFIKSRSSQTAAAAFGLSAVHRWCLSGTPLQNRVSELYSLIRFLRIDPMAYYSCRQKGCDCKSLHYRFQAGKCQHCGHRAFSHYSHFNRHVLNPIQRDGYTQDGRRAMFTLKQEVLDKALLRRTKESKAEDMNLPPRIVTIRSVRLHPVEEDFYNALYTQTKSSFDDYVQQGTLLNNYAHIFDLLTKMRQAVDHPYLIVYSKREMERKRLQVGSTAPGAATAAAAAPAQPAVANGSVDCDMCHEPPTDRVLSSCCGAAFCRACVLEYLTVGAANGAATPCPSCQAPFTIDLNQESVPDSPNVAEDEQGDSKVAAALPNIDLSNAGNSAPLPKLKDMRNVSSGSILRRINLAEFATSTKIEVLVQELVDMRTKRPGSKALVFSQFVNMLDLVRWRLHADPCLQDLGLGVRILHGGMDVKSRDAALRDFKEDNGCRVLLMSLKAAGVALNLTVASECFLLDLWWNPAAEMQAIDRTHRLGQYRPIRAVRFVAQGTVEERVLQLQEKKRLVFDGTVGRDAGSLKMLTVDDMVSLFA